MVHAHSLTHRVWYEFFCATGEWAAEWKVRGASKEDYQRFAQAQLDVYGRATFGWAYWTLKNVQNHWSMEWMINNGYISLKSQG